MKKANKILTVALVAAMAMNMTVATGIVASAADVNNENTNVVAIEENQNTEENQNAEEEEKLDMSEWTEFGKEETTYAKSVTAQEAKDKAKAEKIAEKREKIINQGGAMAGKYFVNVINGKYDNARDAVNAGVMTAGKIVNTCVLKNIPYAGGLISAIVGGVFGLDDAASDPMAATNGKLDNIYNRLGEINDTIKENGEKIDKSVVSESYVSNLNTAAKEMTDLYSAYNNQFANTVKHFGEENCEPTTFDDSIMGYIYSYGDGQKKSDGGSYNLNYYNTFMNFSKTLRNDQFINNYKEFGGNENVFGINDMISKSGNKAFATVENREEFSAKVNAFYGTGYEVLSTAMLYEQNKLEVINCVAIAQADQLQEMIDEKKANGEDTTELESKRKEFLSESRKASIGLDEISTKMDALNAEYTNVKNMINNYNTSLDNEKRDIVNQYSKNYETYTQMNEIASTGNTYAKTEAENMKKELDSVEPYYTKWSKGIEKDKETESTLSIGNWLQTEDSGSYHEIS